MVGKVTRKQVLDIIKLKSKDLNANSEDAAVRMVAGTGATLHLVEPLGFELTEPRLRRAGTHLNP